MNLFLCARVDFFFSLEKKPSDLQQESQISLFFFYALQNGNIFDKDSGNFNGDSLIFSRTLVESKASNCVMYSELLVKAHSEE